MEGQQERWEEEEGEKRKEKYALGKSGAQAEMELFKVFSRDSTKVLHSWRG